MHEDHSKSTKIMKPMKFPDVDDILPHVPSLLISSALPVHLLRQVPEKLKKPLKTTHVEGIQVSTGTLADNASGPHF